MSSPVRLLAGGGGVPGVAARVRERRLAAGLTQADVAGERFSKEYVSQIERGKTPPSAEALAWIAARLGTDAHFLAHGVSAADVASLHDAIARAEQLSNLHDYGEALAVLDEVGGLAIAADDPGLAGSWTSARCWALVQLGELEAARELLDRELATGRTSAEVEFLRGVVAYKHSHIEAATRLFGDALALAAATTPSDRLRSDIYGWRSRCHRRTRDWEAAREDVAFAIELAERGHDSRRAAYSHFQASLVHERTGNWVLARRHAEVARELFEQLGDRANVGHMLNNLGGLAHLLGDSERAIDLLNESFLVAVETGSKPHAAHVLCSMAEVRLASDDLLLAERDARSALDLFDGRIDYLHEIGIAHLTLGRALLEQGRAGEAEAEIRAAEHSFGQIESPGHEAAAGIAYGDLEAHRGATREAATRYRGAAMALLPDLSEAFVD